MFVNLYGADRLTEQMEVETRVELRIGSGHKHNLKPIALALSNGF